jgi:predicted PurR-regulated permease PerM
VIPSPAPEARPPRPPDEQQLVTMLRWLLYLVFVVIGWWIVSHLAAVLAPVLVALGIAYLLNPVLEALVARGLSRGLAALALLGAFLAVVTGGAIVLVPVVIHEVQEFVAALPQMIDDAARWFEANLDIELPKPEGAEGATTWREYLSSPQFQSIVDEAIGPAQALVAAALGGVFSLLAFLAGALLIPVFAYYFLVDWPNLVARVKRVIPPRRRGKVLELVAEIDRVVSGWVRGQGMVMAILAVLYAIGFSIVGIHLAVPIGLLVGLLTVIPFVGTLVGAAIAFSVTLLAWDGVEPVIGVAVVLGVLHVLEALILTPRIVGHRVGLSESAALFAAVAGGKLLGLVGILLAVPLAATCAVLIRHGFRHYERSDLYGREDDALVPVSDAMAVVMPDAGAPGTRRQDPASPDPASPADPDREDPAP